MLQFGIPEIPEKICVKSLIISREEAVSKNLNFLDLSNAAIKPTSFNQAQTPTLSYPQPYSNGAETISVMEPLIKTFADSEMLTDGPNPTRDRIIQTEKAHSVTIGIQCDMEQVHSDLEFNKALQITETPTENFDDFKKRFIDFVKSNTNRYDNGYFECILCGELKPNAKLTAAHLSIHFGPPKLCFRCGIQFDHQILWKSHNCAARRTKYKQQLIKCPHYSCGVHALSPGELYDHLNEHCGMRVHRCLGCRRRFTTAGELRLHRKLHKKCKNTENKSLYSSLSKEDKWSRKRTFIVRTTGGKRMILKTFLSKASKRFNHITRLCCVCLKRCKNFYHYQRHMKRCLAQYRNRIKQKRNPDSKTETPILTNGFNGEHLE